LKKISVLFLALMLVFTVACGDGGVYKDAATSLAEGNYSRAIELLDTIPNHNDKDGIRQEAEAAIALLEAETAFRDAVETAETINASIDSATSVGQGLLDSDSIPFDDSTKTNLQIAISALREMKTVIPDMPDELGSIKDETDKLNTAVDYSRQLENLESAQEAFEYSVRVMTQITNPTGDFIVLRLSEIEIIGDIFGVTEDKDPNGLLNKQGGYTSATFFSSAYIDQSTVYSDLTYTKATDGGGCVEVYATVDGAIKRDTYLASLDGSGFTSGSHTILGTIVIRTSHYLTASQQNELTEQIKEKLIELR